MNRGAQCARRWVVVLCAIMSLLQHAAAECGHSQPAVLHQQRQLLHMFNEDMAAADRQEAATASVVRESALLTSQHTRSLLGHPSTSPHWRRQGGRQLHLAQLLAQSKPARIRIRPIYQLHESDFLSGMGQGECPLHRPAANRRARGRAVIACHAQHAACAHAIRPQPTLPAHSRERKLRSPLRRCRGSWE